MEITEVSSKISELNYSDTKSCIDSNLSFMNNLSSKAVIQNLLQSIIANENQCRSVARRSYRHVNHFDKVVLYDNDNADTYRLTLHIWTPPFSPDQRSDELIHSHRFSFWSSVLAGQVESQSFKENEKGKVYNSYSYCPEIDDTENFYKFKGEVRLAENQTVRTRQDNSYYMDYSSIHRIILPEERLQATLVLRSPRKRETSVVYNTTYPTSDQTLKNQFFNTGGLRDRIERVIDQIGKEYHA